MQIQGHTFLVSGGSSGLGAACVRQLAALQANVVIADINGEVGQALADELGGAVVFASMNVTEEANVQSAVARAIERFGRLHGVINCAGIAIAKKVLGKDGPHELDAFAKVVGINLVGTFNVIRVSAAAMAQNEPNEEGERGVIINTASVAAYDGQIGQAAYSASKGGVVAMTLPIARELARSGIRVMTIAPDLAVTTDDGRTFDHHTILDHQRNAHQVTAGGATGGAVEGTFRRGSDPAVVVEIFLEQRNHHGKG